MTFSRSSYCVNQATCVEVARGDVVQVRDSKAPDGSVLSFTPEEWAAFIAGAKAGEFDVGDG